MLRVARRAVVLIEPIEGRPRPLDMVKALIKKALRDASSDQFEPSGNFIYRVSIREICKMLLGLGYRDLAWKGINDFWHMPFANADHEKLSVAMVATRTAIATQNLLARIRLLQYGLAVVICFKESPTVALRSSLKRSGFNILNLPQNPYNDAASETPGTATAASS